MSKFCANCGSQQPDEANVCGNCGNAFAPENVVPQQVAAKSKKPLIIAVIAAALVVVLVLVLFVFTGGGAAGSPEDAVENYYDFQYYGDVSNYEHFAPQAYWEWKEENDDDFDLDEQIEKLEEMRAKADEKGYFDDISYDFKITDEKDLSEKELKKFKEKLNKEFEISKDSVTAGVKLEITLTGEGDGDKEVVEVEKYALEIDGDWYLVRENGYFYA